MYLKKPLFIALNSDGDLLIQIIKCNIKFHLVLGIPSKENLEEMGVINECKYFSKYNVDLPNFQQFLGQKIPKYKIS